MNLKSNFSLLNIAVYSSVLSLIIFLLLRLLLVYSFASDIGGVENNVIYSVAKVLSGGTLYDDPETNNFNITQYSPIYYYIVIISAKLLKLEPLNDLHTIYIIGRFFSLLFNLLGVYLIYRLLTKSFYVNKKVALISGIIYFIHLTRIHFAARPDALFGLIFIILIYCFVKYFQNSEKKSIYLFVGLLITVISIFIKQSGIQFLVIVPAFFFLIKAFKKFFICGLVLFLLGALAYTLFYNIYGPYFFSNTVSGINNGVSVLRIYDVFSHFFLKYQVLFILGICVSALFFDSKQPLEIRFISFLSIGVFVFAFVTSIKEGSWINYYSEFIAATIILIAVKIEGLSTSLIHNDKIHQFLKVVCTVFLVVLLPNVIVQKLYHEHFQHLKETRVLYQNKQQVALLLNSKLSKNQLFLCFDDQINAMLPMYSAVPNKDLVPSQSKFNYQNFTKSFNTGQIKYVVTHAGSSASSFMGCNFSKFEVIYTDTNFVVYKNNILESF